MIKLCCCCCCCCYVALVMSDSVQPHRRQPTRLPRPWDSPGKNTGVGCHFLLQCVKVKSEREDAQSCPTLSDPMDCSQQAPPPTGFSRKEYWSGVPLRGMSKCLYLHSMGEQTKINDPAKIIVGDGLSLEVIRQTPEESLFYGNHLCFELINLSS